MADMLIYLGSMSFSAFFMAFALNSALMPRLRKWLSIAVFVAVVVWFNYLFHYSAAIAAAIPDFRMRSNIKMIVFWVVWILYIGLAFKNTVKEKILSFMLMVGGLIVAEIALGMVFSVVFNVSADEVRFMENANFILYNVTCIASYAFTCFLVYLAIMALQKQKPHIPVSAAMVLAVILCVNISFMCIIANSNAYNKDTFTRVTLTVSPILILLLSVALYILMRRLSEREILKEKLYWSESIKALELEYYTGLQNKTNEMRKIRHDLKDNLESVKILIRENTAESTQKAEEILQSLDDGISSSKVPVYSQNVIVNTVVSMKAEEARQKGIDFHAAIDVPKELTFDSIDINCVYLNLLNNAIEGCLRTPDETEKSVSIKSAVRAGYLFIKTENPCALLKTDMSGKPKTAKEDKKNHGLGLSLIKDIAEKYDGMFETKIEKGKFTASVTLSLSCADNTNKKHNM